MLTWLLPSLSACQAPASDYELTIVPVFLEGQDEDILDTEPAIKVRLAYPDSDPEVFFAGIAHPGEALTIPDLPPIPAETVVQLIAEDSGEPKDEWNPEATFAFGEATLVAPLALGEKRVELTIELARVEAIGKVGTLRSANRRVDGAVAVVDGAAYVFGGGDPATKDVTVGFSVGAIPITSSSTVLRAEHADDGWTELSEVGTIPSFETFLGFPGDPQSIPADRRAGMTATPVEVDGKPMIFVAGGRYAYFPAYVSRGWFLWDPATNTTSQTGDLAWERSDHLALRLGPNRILLYGGVVGNGDGTPTYEIWKTATFESTTSTHINDLHTGGVGAAGTELGDDAVICGGFRISLRDDVEVLWDPTDACQRITPNDGLQTMGSLPIALGSAAIAPLPDGGLLLTGGIDAQIREDVFNQAEIIGTATVEPALDLAFRYDPEREEWSPVSPMATARAHHAAIALSTGKVLIVGGTGTGSSFFGAINDPVRCSELFDPETNEFTDAGCSDTEQGGAVAVGRGVDDFFVLEGGWNEGLTRDGGGSYGIVRRLPE